MPLGAAAAAMVLPLAWIAACSAKNQAILLVVCQRPLTTGVSKLLFANDIGFKINISHPYIVL